MIWTILVGAVIGALARFLKPGAENMGWIMTILLGIAGSFLANYVGGALGWYTPGETAGWIASVVGAIIVLFVYDMVRRKA